MPNLPKIEDLEIVQFECSKGISWQVSYIIVRAKHLRYIFYATNWLDIQLDPNESFHQLVLSDTEQMQMLDLKERILNKLNKELGTCLIYQKKKI